MEKLGSLLGRNVVPVIDDHLLRAVVVNGVEQLHGDDKVLILGEHVVHLVDVWVRLGDEIFVNVLVQEEVLAYGF